MPSSYRHLLNRSARRRLEKLKRSNKTLAKYLHDPIAFARDVFGVEAWEAPSSVSTRSSQANVLRDIVVNHRVAVRSGHKVGKTTTAAILAWWWFWVIQGSVVVTAATGTQVRTQVWKEVRRLRGVALKRGHYLPPVPKQPSTGVWSKDGEERYILGLATDNTANMGGFSGRRMLFIVDAASGVAGDIVEAVEGNTAGGDEDNPDAVAKILLLGNPTQTSGVFFEAFHGLKDHWSGHHISSEDTPNARAGRVVVPGLATKHYIDKQRNKYLQRYPNVYAVRVRGDFPTQAGNSVVGYLSLEEAVKRWAATPIGDELVIGVDVAREGDDEAVSFARRGAKHIETRAMGNCSTKRDSKRIAGMVLDQVRRLRKPDEYGIRVCVDVIGIGAGVADELVYSKEAELGIITVIEVNVARAANDNEQFVNLRAELWFAAADWIAEEGALQDDSDLRTQLLAMTYSFDNQGRRLVEKKAKLKTRLGCSPDRADALCLTFVEEDDDLSIGAGGLRAA